MLRKAIDDRNGLPAQGASTTSAVARLSRERLIPNRAGSVRRPGALGRWGPTRRCTATLPRANPDRADTVAAVETHRGHAIIEQVHSDTQARRPGPPALGVNQRQRRRARVGRDGVHLTAATITGPRLAKATTATIRRRLIAVPARVASSARSVTLHLPPRGPGRPAWAALFDKRPAVSPYCLSTQQPRFATQYIKWNTPGLRGPADHRARAPSPPWRPRSTQPDPAHRWIEAKSSMKACSTISARSESREAAR